MTEETRKKELEEVKQLEEAIKLLGEMTKTIESVNDKFGFDGGVIAKERVRDAIHNIWKIQADLEQRAKNIIYYIYVETR